MTTARQMLWRPQTASFNRLQMLAGIQSVAGITVTVEVAACFVLYILFI